MDGRRLTIQELRDGLEQAVKKGAVSDGAAILWADNVVDGDAYVSEFNAVPGSVIFGVEFFEDGAVERGTLQIQPAKISKLLN